MTTRARVMALIDTFADESPLVREMAGWVVSGKNDVAIDADTDDKDAAYMDALRRRWPEATDEVFLCEKPGRSGRKPGSLSRLVLIAAANESNSGRSRQPGPPTMIQPAIGSGVPGAATSPFWCGTERQPAIGRIVLSWNGV